MLAIRFPLQFIVRQLAALRARQSWRRRLPQVVCLGGLVVGVLLSPLAESLSWVRTSYSQSQESNRDRVVRLLSEMHGSDAQSAALALQELQQLGITGEQLRFARKLKHPDRQERLRLIEALPDVPEPLRSDLWLELTRDQDRDVRMSAVQSLPVDSVRDATSERLRDMQYTDADPQVRLRARVLTENSRIAGSDRQKVIVEKPNFELMSLEDFAPAPPAESLPRSGSASAAAVRFDRSIFERKPPEPKPDADPVVRPNFLDRPGDEPLPVQIAWETEPWITPERLAPFAFTGPSSILAPEVQEDSHFVPQPDRWRNGFAPSDRYGKGHPWVDDYHGVEGHWWDPYNQNVLKGDFPIHGQHTFFELTAQSLTRFDYRQVPTPTTPFESTFSGDQNEFFGDPNQTQFVQQLSPRFSLFHANDGAFKPLDWQAVVMPVFNWNSLRVQELAIVNPDVRFGTERNRDDVALQEYFLEAKLADLSPNYDFISVRAGSQAFNSDFRGFIFCDTNRGVRLFGNNYANRHQFNLVWFDMLEKETNSGLNTRDDRHQNVVVANYYIQDFIFPGYTAQASFHMNNDQPSQLFDRNNFLVRPDAAGVYQPHRVESYYVGFAGDGHMGRINVNNAFYWVTGRDGLNPIGGQQIDINAFMAALELSYDRDWARFRGSMFWASGDGNPNDRDGEGFDSILDNPNFGGGEFSYWQRQQIGLFGVNLKQGRSLAPDLRSSKNQGQSNFTNPGLLQFTLGFDADVTPKLKMINNASYLMFDETAVLQQFTFQRRVSRNIGLDLSSGFEWRPFHNDNMVVLLGASALVPDQGFKDLYNEYLSEDVDMLYASFAELTLTY